jgi:hypothetical protein
MDFKPLLKITVCWARNEFRSTEDGRTLVNGAFDMISILSAPVTP